MIEAFIVINIFLLLYTLGHEEDIDKKSKSDNSEDIDKKEKV
jgi:hypothetical protein